MRLLDGELKDKSVWEKAGIELPGFDREVMKLSLIHISEPTRH